MSRLALGLLAVIALSCSAIGPAGSPSPLAQTPSATRGTGGPDSPSSSVPATTGPSTHPSASAPHIGQLPFELCDNLHELAAPADWYAVTDPSKASADVLTVRDWAQSKPGYQDIWTDRDQHGGWITVAFNQDAEAREAELVKLFPGTKAVVVSVDWTESQLAALQTQVTTTLQDAGATNFGVARYEQFGMVGADLTYLEPNLLEALQSKFSGQPLCVSGADPALKPPDGPQPTAGQGWRLLADQDETGDPYMTGIAYDTSSYAALWKAVGLKGEPPAVDFGEDIVLWFGAVHGSSCPSLRLDDVVVEPDRPLVHGQITELDQGVCTADAIGHAYVVALDRSELPHGPFAIQLGAEDPPPGVPDERTVVDADLSSPGATTTATHIHQGGQIP